MSSTATTGSQPPKVHWWRGPVGLLLRLGVTALAIYYGSTQMDLSRVPEAMTQLSVQALLILIVLNYSVLGLGVVRWRLLLRNFGASNVPSFTGLYRLYLVGMFYNTFLPGGVGGEFVRGIASRQAFGDDAGAEGLVVVVVERIVGLAALLVVVACATLVYPLPGIPGLAAIAALGLIGATGVIAALAMGPRLADALPPMLAKFARQLPTPRNPGAFVVVLLTSIVMHSMVSFGGHGLVTSMSVDLPIAASLAIIPLAAATVFLPFSISGLGFFEAAFVTLYGLVGVVEHDALAACIGYRLCFLLVAATGGLLAIVGRPLDFGNAEQA